MTEREIAVEDAVEQMKSVQGTSEQPGMRDVAERFVSDWEAQGFALVSHERVGPHRLTPNYEG